MKPHQNIALNGALMPSVRDVAKLLQCSDRHITNLRNDGRMHPRVKLGMLIRWPRTTIENWIVAGCPPLDESAA